MVIAVVLALALVDAPATAYVYCGSHDGRHVMTAHYWNSMFWVDIVEQQTGPWDRVHPLFSINRSKSQTFRAQLGDGANVISWLSRDAMQRAYNAPWDDVTMAKTFTKRKKGCGLILETDIMFNPAISNFTLQTDVPYDLGYHEIVLDELGHVLGLDHEERGLALMAASPKVSNVLHHNEKVGWNRAAAQTFNPLPSPIDDMGIFPLRKQGTSETYADVLPYFVSRGDTVDIDDFTVENLSNVFPQQNTRFRVVLENVRSNSKIEIGWFEWASFQPFSHWSGGVTFTIPFGVANGTYRVTAVFDGKDNDSSNDRAVFGAIEVG